MHSAATAFLIRSTNHPVTGSRLGWTCLLLMVLTTVASAQSQRPNIVMISIDDLNDWVEPLGGHPDVKTPAMQRLAQRGITFTNAHCQAPLCNPSRTSLMSGRRPTSTGVYGLAPWIRQCPEFADIKMMPQHFHDHGYRTLIGGKIYHGGNGRGRDEGQECDVWGPPAKVGVTPKQKLIPPTPGGNHPLMDWGTFDHRDEDKGDWRVASWAVNQIKTMPKQNSDQPFFLSVGFFLPHVPCFATQKWFDMYPDETLTMPPIIAGDRDDTPMASWFIHWDLPEPRTSWLKENNQLRPLVRAYLACISFVDSQVGRVLDAVEQSPYADNTIVVLWSDHGYHLGEKAISGKNSLWARSTHVPLILAGPGIGNGLRCDQPAELLDIYPTLTELAGLPQTDGLEGISLKRQIDSPTTLRRRPAICTHNAGNHSVCDQRWRYIVYADGSEELYDRDADPNETTNLLAQSSQRSNAQGSETSVADQYRQEADRLAAWLPRDERPLAVGSAHRVLEERTDGFYWEEKLIDPDQAIQ
ncbi:Choline-sulfatase [Rubripirellula lacrimiformis]|uniref:Choline-sulfatase n=1 Tax=Rubripirellula lacrimiformis TaxID=1930273 RepID=A0A517N9E1_9BACT|nr:sulfatase [Rubripirellula lacrimiformis]QDT03760.1 Choline-sulfatase [Rubripirellula lacrimiformis]